MPEIELPRAPGLVGELCDWIDSTARKRQPKLSLAASLAFCGALFGRKVQTEWELRTNLYTMGVAPSCAGKEHARTQLNKLCKAAGINNLIGGEDVTSDAAIEVELKNNPVVLYLWDEIGHMMGNIKSSGGGGHTAKIVPMMMKLYTSANKTYHGKSYAKEDEKRRVIEQPHCCVYGTTVPGRLYDGMDTNELIDGWLGRVLVFATDSDPDQNWDCRPLPPPKHIVKLVTDWANYQPSPDMTQGDIVAASTLTPTIVKMTEDALDTFKSMDTMVTQYKQDARKEGLGMDNLWGRAVENAQKLALIIAAGDTHEDELMIRTEHAEWAFAVILNLVNELCDAIRANVGDNDHDRNRKKLLSVIQKAGRNGIRKSSLTRKTQWTNKRTRDDLLTELIEAEQVLELDDKSGNGITLVCVSFAPGVA